MAGTSYLIDSNVLLRWVKPDHTDYPIVVSTIDLILQTDAALVYTQNLGEFWNACTRPANRNGYGLSPQDADRKAQFFEARLRLLPDSIAVHHAWREMLKTYNIAGVQVHDARLVAAMRVHGVSHILTFNSRDFARYSNIHVVDPHRTSVP